MTNHSLFHKLTVAVLLVATIFVTTPVSAADFNTKAALGSISGVGSVELRGVSLEREGTLFAGDHVNVGSGSGAKILLTDGRKIVLDQLTSLTFVAGGQVQIGKGNVAFSSKSGKLNIVAGQYQIEGDRDLAGNVSFVGADYVGLRVNTGNAVVLNLKTRQIYKVAAGQERLFSATTGNVSTPITQLASNVPAPIPALPPIPQRPTPPQTPAPQKSGISHSGWIAIFATVGGAAAAIAVLATRGNDETDNTAVILARQKAATAATAAQSTATTANTDATSLASTCTSANAAINGSTIPAGTKTTLTGNCNAISSAATASQQQIATLTSQLTTLQSQLTNTTDATTIASITAQVNTVISNLNSQTSILNAQIAALNALLAQAQTAGVTGLPTLTITPIPTVPGVASASIPT